MSVAPAIHKESLNRIDDYRFDLAVKFLRECAVDRARDRTLTVEDRNYYRDTFCHRIHSSQIGELAAGGAAVGRFMPFARSGRYCRRTSASAARTRWQRATHRTHARSGDIALAGCAGRNAAD